MIGMRYMTQTAARYARVLAELPVPEEDVRTAKEVFQNVPELKDILASPLVSGEAKERVIDRVFRGFPRSFCNFLKVACLHEKTGQMEAILECYGEILRERKGILSAGILCVTPPSGAQLEGFREFLCRRHQKNEVEFTVRQDPSLIGGFILRAGDFEYDYSLRGKYRRLEQQLTRR